MLLDAARHAEIDYMRGVSSNVMCGQTGNYGTGAFNIVLDMSEMQKLENAELKRKTGIENMFGMTSDEGMCSKNNIMIRNNISNIKKDKQDSCQDDDYNMGF